MRFNCLKEKKKKCVCVSEDKIEFENPRRKP